MVWTLISMTGTIYLNDIVVDTAVTVPMKPTKIFFALWQKP